MTVILGLQAAYCPPAVPVPRLSVFTSGVGSLRSPPERSGRRTRVKGGGGSEPGEEGCGRAHVVPSPLHYPFSTFRLASYTNKPTNQQTNQTNKTNQQTNNRNTPTNQIKQPTNQPTNKATKQQSNKQTNKLNKPNKPNKAKPSKKQFTKQTNQTNNTRYLQASL